MSEPSAVGNIPQWTIADRMRKAREVTGLNQGDFADEIGISRGSISNYESGAIRPRKIVLKAVALRAGVPLSWLETGTPEHHEPGPAGEGLPRLDSNQQPSGYTPSQVSDLRAERIARRAARSDRPAVAA